MRSIVGQYSCAYVFAADLEDSAIQNIVHICDTPSLKGRRIAIMPDAHSNGDGTVTGFTLGAGDRVFLSLEHDAGCGVRASKIKSVQGDIDFQKLDALCHRIPAGKGQFYFEPAYDYDFSSLHCAPFITHVTRYPVCLGSLGGGNHFIELDKDEDGNLYLIIHNGLGYLSKAMVDYYKGIALAKSQKNKEEATIEDLVLEGEEREHFLHDMDFFVKLCSFNREYIEKHIINGMGYEVEDTIDICHHYTSPVDGIARHGAISARQGERVIIPVNAKEGCLLGVGKGNPDWNYSAPHGGGRLFSRKKARATFKMEEYRDAMKGIYSSSVLEGNIDEIPMAYRDLETIKDAIKDSVEVTHVLKPLYSYKGI